MKGLKFLSNIRLPSRGDSTSRRPLFGIVGAPMHRGDSRKEYDRAVEDADRSSLIMICVDWIASEFPVAKWKLEQKVDDIWTPVESHPVIDLLNNPTPHHTGSELLSVTVVDWNFHGEGYWLIVGGSQPEELWWRSATSIIPKRDSKGYLSHYDYRVDGRIQRLEVDEVIQIRRRQRPDNPWRGVSPLEALGNEIWNDTEAAKYSATMVHNLGMPGWIAAPKDTKHARISDDDLRATKQKLKDEYQGDGRGDPWILSLPMDITRMAFNPEELNLKGLRDFSEQRTCGMFKLPAAVVQFGTGLEQTTENATLEQYEKQAWQTGLIPIHTTFGEQVTRQLLPKFGLDVETSRLNFDFGGVQVLQEDLAGVDKIWLDRLNSGAVTRYEYRKKMTLEVTDLDKVWYMPGSLTEVPAEGFPEGELRKREEKAAEMVAAMNSGGDDDDPDDDSDDADSNEPPSRRAFTPMIRALSNQDRLLRRFNMSGRRLTDEYADILTDEFNGLGRMAARAYRKIIAERSSVRQLSSEDEEVIRAVLEEMKIQDWKNEVLRQKVGEALILRTLETTVRDIESVINLPVNIPDPVRRQTIADGGTRLLGIDVAGQSRRAVFDGLHEGNVAGDGAEKMARRIRDNVSRGRFRSPQARALVIARTETMFAQNKSTMTAYEHTEEIQRVQAKDNQLGYDDDDCSERDGQIFSIAEAKAIQDHPNGTLLWLPVV